MDLESISNLDRSTLQKYLLIFEQFVDDEIEDIEFLQALLMSCIPETVDGNILQKPFIQYDPHISCVFFVKKSRSKLHSLTEYRTEW